MSKKRKIIYFVLAAIPILFFVYVVASVLDNAHRWAFVSAAGQGDIPKVRRFLSEGMQPDTPSYFPGSRPLSQAAFAGRYDTVKVLLDAGANPDYGLRTAIIGQRVTVVKLLLARGANPNLQVQCYDVPCSLLSIAKEGEKSNPEIIALLKAAGAR